MRTTVLLRLFKLPTQRTTAFVNSSHYLATGPQACLHPERTLLIIRARKYKEGYRRWSSCPLLPVKRVDPQQFIFPLAPSLMQGIDKEGLRDQEVR